ncbi:MAG: nuclear transport factor 2 family protein [Hyphomonadaceae bacterium]|nr:nuclear transport factor 2 family protein [Hyphomonadaceae bacterium]
MRNVIIASMVVAILPACAPAPASFDADTVRSEVTALVQRWSDSGEAGDWDAVADTYADIEGFAWIEQGEVRYPDRAAIIEGLEQARAANLSITNDVSDISVTPLGADAAAYHASYRLVARSESFGFESRGVLSGVAIRQADGWRLLQGAFSESRPEDGAEAQSR